MSNFQHHHRRANGRLHRRPLVVVVRAERGRITVERPGTAPWSFPPEDTTAALAFAKSAARLFNARLVLDGIEEGVR
jgi:hypothetical protein